MNLESPHKKQFFIKIVRIKIILEELANRPALLEAVIFKDELPVYMEVKREHPALLGLSEMGFNKFTYFLDRVLPHRH